MEIVDCQNPNKVKYFDLRDYIDNIKIDPFVLEHMEETNKNFDIYMKKINICEEEDVIHLWIMNTAEEIVKSNQIENHFIKKQDILKENLFFDTLKMSHNRIHELHHFVMQDNSEMTGYRNEPIKVSAIYKDKTEKVFWYGPEPEDVEKFMDTFIKVYKSSDMSVINSNPFLKSALIQLLFIRIHPYMDGNGRTSRVLHSIKLTESINKIYGKNYRLCPLNISASVLINQITYVNILDNLYFDLEHDNSEYINKWFNFVLNMIDEQLYYQGSKLESLNDAFDLYKCDDQKFKEMMFRILNDMIALDDINDYDQEKVYKLLK